MGKRLISLLQKLNVSATGILNPMQLIRLNQQINELTEEIEELKYQKAGLQSSLHCDSDQEMKKYEAYIGRMSQSLERLEQQRDSLLKEINRQADQFKETKAGVDPDDSLSLMDSRLMIRDSIQAKDMQSLKDEYGKLFDYTRFQRASKKLIRGLAKNLTPSVHEEESSPLSTILSRTKYHLKFLTEYNQYAGVLNDRSILRIMAAAYIDRGSHCFVNQSIEHRSLPLSTRSPPCPLAPETFRRLSLCRRNR